MPANLTFFFISNYFKGSLVIRCESLKVLDFQPASIQKNIQHSAEDSINCFQADYNGMDDIYALVHLMALRVSLGSKLSH